MTKESKPRITKKFSNVIDALLAYDKECGYRYIARRNNLFIRCKLKKQDAKATIKLSKSKTTPALDTR